MELYSQRAKLANFIIMQPIGANNQKRRQTHAVSPNELSGTLTVMKRVSMSSSSLACPTLACPPDQHFPSVVV